MTTKLYLFIISVFLVSFSLQAQEEDTTSNQGNFYLTAGMNLSRFVGDDVVGDLNNRFSPYAGIGFDYTFSKSLGLGAEILYSTQGFKGDGFIDTGFGNLVPSEIILSVDYISIPISLKASLTENLKFDIGPTMNIKVNEETEATAFNLSIDEDAVQDFYFGAHAGLSFKITGGLGGQLRYNRGLSRVFRDVNFGGGERVENKVYSSFFSFGLTFSFQ